VEEKEEEEEERKEQLRGSRPAFQTEKRKETARKYAVNWKIMLIRRHSLRVSLFLLGRSPLFNQHPF